MPTFKSVETALSLIKRDESSVLDLTIGPYRKVTPGQKIPRAGTHKKRWRPSKLTQMLLTTLPHVFFRTSLTGSSRCSRSTPTSIQLDSFRGILCRHLSGRRCSLPILPFPKPNLTLDPARPQARANSRWDHYISSSSWHPPHRQLPSPLTTAGQCTSPIHFHAV